MKKKKVLIGITSGIAAYKALDLLIALKKDGFDVFVAMTQNARKVVAPKAIEKISGNKVYTELFEKDFDYKDILQKRKVEHIDLADSIDLMVIVPATANVVAKLAYGIADDFLTTTALAVTKPIIICPAMNVNMWNNPVVQENLQKLRSLGYYVIPPTKGMLACGYEGVGRLENIDVIKDEIQEHLQNSTSLNGKTVIVTAGATKEKIDDVRYITNRSTGKMGVAIAEACYRRGAKVILLRAHDAVKPRYIFQDETFSSVEELASLLKQYSPQADYIYHTAAVGDFGVENKQAGKISSSTHLILQLKVQKKLVNEIKKINPLCKLIAFKAEYALPETELIERAKQKLIESNADAVVANDMSQPDRGFAADTNEVILVTKTQNSKIPHATKKEIAEKIVDFVTQKL